MRLGGRRRYRLAPDWGGEGGGSACRLWRREQSPGCYEDTQGREEAEEACNTAKERPPAGGAHGTRPKVGGESPS